MKGVLLMSNEEINRLKIINQLNKKEIKQKRAARILGLSVRQIRRLKERYQKSGAAGLVHKNRGRESNNKIPDKEIRRTIRIVKKKYWDFGPTFALEKLQEHHQVKFSRETLRKAMIKANLWESKRQRKPQLHQLRERRACEGELIQIDASPHAWFENRNSKCNLLGHIDDATSKVKWLEFFEGETTTAYFKTTRGYLIRHGKPLAIYVDKNSIFRINTSKSGTSSTQDSQGLTQFGRAMKQLGIELISAHSAQAKGRVERLFQTLQDRLVKELRLRDICTKKEANHYLPEFIDKFNQKFAVVPRNLKDAHLPLSSSEKKNLEKILAFQEKRVLSRELTCQFENKLYQIKTNRPTYAMRNAPVLVIKDLNGKVTIRYKNKELNYKITKKQPKQKIVDSKQLNNVVDKIKKEKSSQEWSVNNSREHNFAY